MDDFARLRALFGGASIFADRASVRSRSDGRSVNEIWRTGLRLPTRVYLNTAGVSPAAVRQRTRRGRANSLFSGQRAVPRQSAGCGQRRPLHTWFMTVRGGAIVAAVGAVALSAGLVGALRGAVAPGLWRRLPCSHRQRPLLCGAAADHRVRSSCATWWTCLSAITRHWHFLPQNRIDSTPATPPRTFSKQAGLRGPLQ